MPENALPWLKDNSTVYHKITRILLFLTSFSWTFNPIQDYMGESTPIEKILTRMLPMGIVAVYCMTCRYKDHLQKLFRPACWVILWYIVWGFFARFSGIQPSLCLWKGMEIFITLMWVCVSCRDKESTAREFSIIAGYIEILMWMTVVLAVIRPSLGFLRSPSFLPWIKGYFPMLNPNTIGALSVFALTRLLFLPAKYKAIRITLVTLTLLFAQSRTSYGIMAVALLIYVFDGIRHKHLWRTSVASVCALLALIMTFGWLDSLMTFLMRGESIEEVRTLSGRTDFWDIALQHITWNGNGLATGTRSLIFTNPEMFDRAVSVHNSFLEALIGAGYVGAGPFLFVFIWYSLKQLFKAMRGFQPMDVILAIYVIMFVARSMTSIAMALFSTDFILLMMFWAWIWNSRQTHPVTTRERPKPVVYQKTLNEMQHEGSE